MRSYIYLLLILIRSSLQAVEKTAVLSTKQYQEVKSTTILEQIQKNDRDLYFIASVNVDGEQSGLDLEKATYERLELENFQSYAEDCEALHELLNKTFERLGFKFVEKDENLTEVEAGLWFYLPRLTNTSLNEFKKLVERVKANKNLTLMVTNCNLLKTKEALKNKSEEEADDEDGIRTTPIIFQQITVVVSFMLIALFGVYFALNVKTPSSLLAPQQVKAKLT